MERKLPLPSQLQSNILKGEKRLLKKPTSLVLKQFDVCFLYIKRQSSGNWKRGSISQGMVCEQVAEWEWLLCLSLQVPALVALRKVISSHLSGGSDSGQQTESNCHVLLPLVGWLHHYKVIITRRGQKLEGTMGIINDSLHQVNFFPSSLKFKCCSIEVLYICPELREVKAFGFICMCLFLRKLCSPLTQLCMCHYNLPSQPQNFITKVKWTFQLCSIQASSSATGKSAEVAAVY